jgi:circadian clock protein KaiC
MAVHLLFGFAEQQELSAAGQFCRRVRTTVRMANKKAMHQPRLPHLAKVSSGIRGLDEISGGGLPKGRPTLVCGGTGTGKTLLAMEFLVRGATDYGEPGVFVSFEERPAELAANVSSLGFRLKELQARKKIAIEYVRIERSEIEETGDYNLQGLFIRVGSAIDSIKARRIAFDTLESLFAGLTNHSILRAELGRLFGWLKDRGITAVITAERGEGALTRYGLEEYVADCVMLLEHRVSDEVSTRYLRIVKYRGSTHATNEFPFLIGKQGLSVLPITSVMLGYRAPRQRVSSGIARLDTMFDGKGFYRGSAVLITGNPGTGKTTFAASFASAVCRGGGRCLYASFEESPAQIMRDLRSTGIELRRWADQGLLLFHAIPPTAAGLEEHLLAMWELLAAFKPDAVVLDPITNLIAIGARESVTRMLMRLIAHMKNGNILSLSTALVHGGIDPERALTGVSSVMDSCIVLTNREANGERNRQLYILKSRGMRHSNQVREFQLTESGVRILDVYTGTGTVLTGSARMAQEAAEQQSALERSQEAEHRRRELIQRRDSLRAQIRVLLDQIAAEEQALERSAEQEKSRLAASTRQQQALAHSRMADSSDGANRAQSGNP